MKRLVLVCCLLLCSSASAATPTKFSLVNGCWAVGGSGPLRFQASALGEYLLYTKGGRYRTPSGDVAAPSANAVWKVGNDLTVVNAVSGARLGTPRAATGCASFPEVALNATGTPSRGTSTLSGVKGVLDQHAHLMAFEFLGGDFHCGRPWSRFGVKAALPDCESIQGPRGTAAPVQNFLDFGDPAHPHDTVGWPTFNDWPKHFTLSYEQTYYRWLQRAWMGGLRLVNTNMVDNEVLCRTLPRRHTTCNDMDSVRLQVTRLRQLQDYVDAQSGGPGKGWFRIVTDPFQARKVINQGKLAVVQGIEVSRMFGCGVKRGVPQCGTGDVDRGLDEMRALGIRAFYPIHKFDNAFGGTRMDGGPVGTLINGANQLETGAFWALETCTDPQRHDKDQLNPTPAAVSAPLGGALNGLVGPGTAPVYPATPHCNKRGLTKLGGHVLNGMMDRRFLIEIDHMSSKAAKQSLGIIEGRRYPGIMSSHTWSNDVEMPKIRALGGSVTPYAGDSQTFAAKWKADRVTARSPNYPYSIGYGADTNGLGAQGAPRPGASANPVKYPFKSGDGAVTFNRQVSGSQQYDINADGVAHYGLMPDWLEDLRIIAGPQITRDLFKGAEGYLGMWERTEGIPGPSCPAGSVGRRGLGAVRLGRGWKTVLRRAGQPWSRPGRTFRWCYGGDPVRVRAVFSRGRVGLVGRTGPAPAAIRASSKRLTRGLRVAPAGRGRVFLIRGERSHAVARKTLVRTKARAKRAMRSAGL